MHSVTHKHMSTNQNDQPKEKPTTATKEIPKLIPKITVIEGRYQSPIHEVVRLLSDPVMLSDQSEANATSISDNNGGRITLDLKGGGNRKA